MTPIEINSVRKLIEEMKMVAPRGMGPGFYSSIAITNANIWRIVDELEELLKRRRDREKMTDGYLDALD